jgi:FG-GAP repeat protein
MRKSVIAAALLVGTASILVPVTSPPAAAATCAEGPKAVPDFDGSGGTRPDLVVGIPGEDLNGRADAGLVEIRYAGDTRAPQSLHGPGYLAGDRFGTALLTDDVNFDNCTDLLVGTPGRDVGGKADAGSVEVYLGSPTGLSWSRTITMSLTFPSTRVQAGAQFGSVLSAYTDGLGGTGPFIAGMPLYDAGTPNDLVKDAGAVMDFALDGPIAAPFTQDNAPIDGVAEPGDHFGAQVIGGYWEGDDRSATVSAPLEDVGSAKDAGAVFNCGGSTSGPLECTGMSQDTPDVPGAVEAGDRFGAALAGRFIGVPGEDIGSVVDAGMVVAYDTEGISQETPGVPGASEAGDQFGAALAVFQPERPELDLQYVHIGVPGEDLGSARDAGLVATVRQPLDPVQPAEGVGGLSADPTAGTVDAGDRYGASLGTYQLPVAGSEAFSELLLIGSPGAASSAGEVVLAETGDQGTALLRSEAWRQITGAPEPGDAYGSDVSSLPWTSS